VTVNIILDDEHRARMRELVDRLRSGDFKQAQERLNGGGISRCCLGVECEIFAEHFGGEWEDTWDDGEYIPGFVATVGTKPEGHYMPHEVGIYLLGEAHTDIPFSWHSLRDEVVKASHLNDWGFTFDQIADCLEWEYLS